MILQYNADMVNPRYTNTNIEPKKNINADFLLTYQVNAWTALYLGYNRNLQNIALLPTSTGSQIVRTQVNSSTTHTSFSPSFRIF